MPELPRPSDGPELGQSVTAWLLIELARRYPYGVNRYDLGDESRATRYQLAGAIRSLQHAQLADVEGPEVWATWAAAKACDILGVISDA